MKKPINEFARMQELAGINEIKVRTPSKNLKDIIIRNKKKLSIQFYLGPGVEASWGDEGEPIVLMDDDGKQVDFIKKEDWEANKEFYNNNQGTGEIAIDGVNIIYVIN